MLCLRFYRKQPRRMGQTLMFWTRMFDNTESYLQIEQEILELQQSLKKGRSGLEKKEKEEKELVEEEEKSVFMDEGLKLIEQEQEQMAVKAYAEEYEATLAAESCSSMSLPLSYEDG
ncbi:hypothetical protein BGZ58_004178 [Dissophora ornata]|nr:hypothetical protein BGZ58_004178 [Dissophora ornata]